MRRREVLKGFAGMGAVLGSGKAVDNVLIGYGPLIGTNLVDQDLSSIAATDFGPAPQHEVTADGYRLTATPGTVEVRDGDSLVAKISVGEEFTGVAASIDDDLGLPGAVEQLVTDLSAINRGAVTFEFHGVDDFFDRVRAAEPRPYSTGAVRHWAATDPDLVQTFTGASPADPAGVLAGLVDGFRERTYYDVPRYVAGSIQDNVIFGAADLRAPFRQPVDFESILDSNERTGLFCYEFTHRSLEALHAVPAPAQTVPVVGARVLDTRHKHVYTGVASLIRDDGLRVPMTFVDYTHTTLYRDLGVRGVLGEGFEAYNERHRATAIHWSPYRR